MLIGREANRAVSFSDVKGQIDVVIEHPGRGVAGRNNHWTSILCNLELVLPLLFR